MESNSTCIEFSGKDYEPLEILARTLNESREIFFGKVTASRLVRMIISSHLYRSDFEGVRSLVALRKKRFSEDIELVPGECPNCKLCVDEKFFPILQRVKNGPIRCVVCGTVRPD